MKKNYTTDDFLRQKLGEDGAAPDADALWADFEPMLEGELFSPKAVDPAAVSTAAGSASGLFGGLGGWAAALAIGAVLGAGAVLFSDKTAGFLEKTGETATSAPLFEDEKGASEWTVFSKNGESTAAASAFETEKAASEQAEKGQSSAFEMEKAQLRPSAFLAEKAVPNSPRGGSAASTSLGFSKKSAASSHVFLTSRMPKAATEKAVSEPLFLPKNGSVTTPPTEPFQRFSETVETVLPPSQSAGEVKMEVEKGAAGDGFSTEKSTEKAVEKAKIQPFSPLLPSKAQPAEPSKRADQAAVFSKIRRPELQKIRGRTEVIAFFGSDLERPNSKLLGRANSKDWVNFGLGFRTPIPNSLWHGRGEIWWAQVDLPTVAVASVSHFDLDGERFTVEDTLWMHRMAGVSVVGQMERRLWGGFSMLGGLSVSYLPFVTAREQFSNNYSTIKADNFTTINFAFSDPLETPSPLRRWQFGPRIGLEKTFFDHFFIGAAISQNLIDYTKAGSGLGFFQNLTAEKTFNDGYRVQRNWLAYVGYRF